MSVLSAVMADFSPGARSPWKHNPCPFVYIYDKIGDLDICIDARFVLAYLSSSSSSSLAIPLELVPPIMEICTFSLIVYKPVSY